MYILHALTFLFLLNVIKCNDSDSSIIIDLSETGSRDVYIQNYTITSLTVPIILLNLKGETKFFILQVHTHTENVMLSYPDSSIPNECVTGKNVGLYWGKNMNNNWNYSTSIGFYLKRHSAQKPLNILLAINTYEEEDPAPGGCSVNQETEYIPNQEVTYDTRLISVTAEPPALYKFNDCAKNAIKTDFFYIKMNQSDHYEDPYFKIIQKMITVEQIEANAIKAKSGAIPFKHTFYRYSGLGFAFVMVSTVNNRSSVYVPAVSFGCDITKWESNCNETYGAFWIIFYISLSICGLFVALFRVNLNMFTLLAIVIHILFVKYAADSDTGAMIYSVLLGLLLSLIINITLKKYLPFSSKIVSQQLNNILFGCLTSLTSIHCIGYIHDFTPSSFWTTFVVILVPAAIFPIYFGGLGPVLTNSFLGSYAVAVTASNFFDGSKLKLIYVNMLMRSTTTFDILINIVNFSWRDSVGVLIWVVTCMIGMAYPYMLSRSNIQEERIPLISE